MCARSISCGTCSNLRDVGGYVTFDGRFRTRHKRLYRSDTLIKVPVTNENVIFLTQTLNIGYAIDLRSEAEQTSEPYEIDGITRFNCAVEPGNVLRILHETPHLDEEIAVNAMIELYRTFVLEHKESYRRLFRIILEKLPERKAIVFHCTAGKDRTGYATALILSALGVSTEVIFEDYLLTNHFFKAPPPETSLAGVLRHRIDPAGLKALFNVRAEYLQASFDTILSMYSSVTEYIINELQVSEEELEFLKSELLEPVQEEESRVII